MPAWGPDDPPSAQERSVAFNPGDRRPKQKVGTFARSLTPNPNALRARLLPHPVEEPRHPLVFAKRGHRTQPLCQLAVRIERVELLMARRAKLRRGDLHDGHTLAPRRRFGRKVVDRGARNLPLAKLATRVISHPLRYVHNHNHNHNLEREAWSRRRSFRVPKHERPAPETGNGPLSETRRLSA